MSLSSTRSLILKNNMFHKGDIVLIPFPFTDLSGVKVRPAVLLAAHKKSNDIVVAFVTSKTTQGGQFNVILKPDWQNGLKVQSTVLCDKIATLDCKVIVGKIGTCDTKIIHSIDVELKNVFKLL